MQEQQNKRPSWSRRKFFINEHFQLHFIAFTMVVALAACVFFYVTSSYFFTKYHALAIDIGMRPSHPFFTVLYNMEDMLTNLFIEASVGVVIASIIGGMLFSHKIAGPMYRLKKHMESVTKGETLSDVGFRKNDYFGDVATAYNLMLAKVRDRIGQSGDGPKAPANEEISTDTPIAVSQDESELKKAG